MNALAVEVEQRMGRPIMSSLHGLWSAGGLAGALLGFACVRFGRFKPFWPLAPVYPAPPAIFLAALRRFRGPAVFLGLRTSSRLGAPFWPSGLTLRSSGPAFCGPLTLAVRYFWSLRCHSCHLKEKPSLLSKALALQLWLVLNKWGMNL